MEPGRQAEQQTKAGSKQSRTAVHRYWLPVPREILVFQDVIDLDRVARHSEMVIGQVVVAFIPRVLCIVHLQRGATKHGSEMYVVHRPSE
jgi:hypothetical protein